MGVLGVKKKEEMSPRKTTAYNHKNHKNESVNTSA